MGHLSSPLPQESDMPEAENVSNTMKRTKRKSHRKKPAGLLLTCLGPVRLAPRRP